MGKVKNKRRLHNKAVKALKQDDDSMDTEVTTEQKDPQIPTMTEASGGGVFSNLNIDVGRLENNLPDLDDARSVISSKSLRGLNMTKKDKRKVKREFLMKKLDVIESVKREAKDKKQREKTAIVGDLQPLGDTLPTLEWLLKKSSGNSGDKSKPVMKAKGIQKHKKRQKDMLDDINLFKQVLSHPAYQENPLGTISEHLQNKQKVEDS